MADDVTLTWSADFSDLTDSLRAAQQAASDAFDSVCASADKASAALGESLSAGTDQATESVSKLGEQTEQAGGSIAQLSEKVSYLGELFQIDFFTEWGEKILNVGEQVVEKLDEIRNQAELLGLTQVEFQGLGVAAEEVGVSSNIAERGVLRLVSQFQRAQEGSGRLRAVFKDLGLSMEDITNPAFTTDQLLEKIGAALEQGGRQGIAYTALIKDLGLRYAELAPVLEKLTEANGGLAKSGESVWAVTKEENAALTDLGHIIQKAWTATKNAVIGSTGDILIGVQEAGAAIERGNAVLGHNAIAAGAATAAQKAYAASLDATKSAASSTASAGGGGGGGGGQGAAAQKESAAERALALDDLKFKIQLTKEGSEERLAAEQAYYAAVKAEFGAGSSEEIGAHQQVLLATKQYNDQIATDSKEMYNSITRDAAQMGTTIKAVVKDAYADMAADGKAFTTAVEEQDKEAEKEAESSYKRQLQEFERMAKAITAEYDKMGRVISNSLNHAIDGMLTKGLSFKQAMKEIAQSILEAWIKSTLQQVTHWASMELAKMALSRLAAAQHVALAASSSAQTTAIEGAAAQKSILTSAAQAAAATYKSVAQIPYVGWILAPIAAAGIFAAALAFGSDVASAEGGFDVPNDTLAQLHKNEMVLPAHISTGLKGLIAGGGGGGGGFGGGGGVTNVHVHAWDDTSVRSWVSKPKNRDMLAGAVHSAYRRQGQGQPLRAPQ